MLPGHCWGLQARACPLLYSGLIFLLFGPLGLIGRHSPRAHRVVVLGTAAAGHGIAVDADLGAIYKI